VPAVAAVGAPDAGHGKMVFDKNCAGCHGAHGEGAVGPTLVGVGKKLDEAGVVKWIKQPSDKMPKLFPGALGEQDVIDVAAYVRQF
jgi:mono/diheme cytochrome c family protein